MKTRLTFAVVALLACGWLAAGCGGSKKATTTVTAAPATSVQDTTSGITVPGPGTPATPTTAAAAITAAIAACKQSVVAAAGVADNVKSDLMKLCDKAATGDQAAVQKISRTVCRKIVEANVPAGAARTQALAACDRTGTTPPTPAVTIG